MTEQHLTREQLYFELLENAKGFKTYSAWRRKAYNEYRKAMRRGWHKQIVKEAGLQILATPRTYEECKAIASQYKTRGEWYRKDHTTYYYARQRGWIELIGIPKGKAGRPKY